MAAARLSRRKRGAGGFEAWTLWGEMSAPMLCDLAPLSPYGDLTGNGEIHIFKGEGESRFDGRGGS